VVDDDEEALAHVRDVFATGGPRGRDRAIRELASALGYARVGRRVRERMDGLIRAAVRRGILDNANGELSPLCRSITEYTRDHLITMLLAAMGQGWWHRDKAINAAARHIGFRRTGSEIRKAFKSAINGAIRRMEVEYDGEWIRRV